MLKKCLLLLGVFVGFLPSPALALFPRGGATSSVTSLAPDQISGLQLWLEGDVGILKSGGGACGAGDTLATWQDQSGTSHDAAALAGSVICRPGLKNSHGGLEFDGSSTYLTNTYTGDPGTIVVVYYIKNWSGGQTQALLGADTSDSVQVGAYQMEPYGNNGYGLENYQRFTTADTTNAAISVWHSEDSPPLVPLGHMGGEKRWNDDDLSQVRIRRSIGILQHKASELGSADLLGYHWRGVLQSV